MSRRPLSGPFRWPTVWWEEDAAARGGPLVPQPPLRGATTADVCVVGGGFVGLWTALRIAERAPGADVVLLDADRCGAGASGRNGGFVHSLWPAIGALADRIGLAAAGEVAVASEREVDAIRAFCADRVPEADFRQRGWLWTSTAPAQDGAWSSAVATAARLGLQPLTPVDRDALRRRLGAPVHRDGVEERCAAIVQPALLARGLRRAVLDAGVRIHEQSPVLDVDPQTAAVRTADGTVRAARTVLALGAWATQVPALRRHVMAVSSDVVATAPMADALAASGWTGDEGASNSRLMVDYYRPTADGRIVFGRGGGTLAYGGRLGVRDAFAAGRARAVEAALRRLVPAAAGVPVTHAWGGLVDRTADGVPWLGRIDGGPVLFAAGFSGNGVGPSALLARTLAARALDADDAWARSPLWDRPPAALPPEPLRSVGGHIVLRAVQRKERLEDDGRTVDAVTRRIAALTPGAALPTDSHHP